ncbi:adenylate/guanylate cyclase domain-containing protein [Rhizobium herbae]
MVAVFVFLDACLLTYILIVPPSFYVEGWTPQINLRLTNFLFIGIFLVSMALSYSPWLVVWAGVASLLAWVGGFLWIAGLPDTVLSSSRDTLDTGMSSEAVITLFLDRNTVSVTAFFSQIVFLVLTTLILTVTVWRSRHLVRSQVAAERGRTALSRYFSPNIVKALSRSSAALEKPVVQPAAILFADMVGFTALTEHMAPVELIGLLREFHGRLAQTTFAYGGTVDKYIGDEIMVHFGTPEPQDDDPVRALNCAAAMIEEIRVWNLARTERGEVNISFGIGVHYGNVVVGNIGHAQRLEYTVVGDTVNVASRLERLTRETKSKLVVSDELVSAVRERGFDPAIIVVGLRSDESHHVRGRDQLISVWCLPSD